MELTDSRQLIMFCIRPLPNALAMIAITGGLASSIPAQAADWGGRIRCRPIIRRSCECEGHRAHSSARAVPASGTQPSAAKSIQDPPVAVWQPLFDGRTLDGWKSTNFGGEGDVTVADGQILLDFGTPLTGITYVNQVATMNYELRLQAMKRGGNDFFCGLTFPVQDSHCSLIVGGWAGSVVGISSINGSDASQNETTRYMDFEQDRWYRIQVRVRPQRLEAWIDDQQIVDQDLTGRRLSTRNEVILSRPLGICAYQTRAALRDVEIRSFSP